MESIISGPLTGISLYHAARTADPDALTWRPSRRAKRDNHHAFRSQVGLPSE
jgi:hypothetical protein